VRTCLLRRHLRYDGLGTSNRYNASLAAAKEVIERVWTICVTVLRRLKAMWSRLRRQKAAVAQGAPTPPSSSDAIVTPPERPDQRIWRYQDFSKFTSTLERGGLFFARATVLDDQFEGSFPESQPPLDRLLTMSPDIEKFIRSGFKTISIYGPVLEISKWFRQWVVVNCWHMNEAESVGMWDLYTRSRKAVCIQSTYGRLRDCFGDPPAVEPGWFGDRTIRVGMVHYEDYKKVKISVNQALAPFFTKKLEFAHERELRAIEFYWPVVEPDHGRQQPDLSVTPKGKGVWRSADLNHLIESIIVAPKASDEFIEEVKKAMARHQLDKPVVRSTLDDTPTY